MLVSRPIKTDEPDLLVGHEGKDLRYVACNGREIATVAAPKAGWTHDALERVTAPATAAEPWDAYLGAQWVGSSEV
jgi:hypothetical protein